MNPQIVSDAIEKGVVEFGGWLIGAGLIAAFGVAVRLWKMPPRMKRLEESNERLSRGFVVLVERHRRALDAQRRFMYEIRRQRPELLAGIQQFVDDMRDDLYRASGNVSHRPKPGPLLPGHGDLRRVLTGEE